MCVYKQFPLLRLKPIRINNSSNDFLVGYTVVNVKLCKSTL